MRLSQDRDMKDTSHGSQLLKCPSLAIHYAILLSLEVDTVQYWSYVFDAAAAVNDGGGDGDGDACSKDVRLPVQMQRAMAAEAEATREAKAKVWFGIITWSIIDYNTY